MGYFTELAKAIVNFIQEVNKIKEKYHTVKKKKSKEKLLNELKKLERELYPEHQWTINDCETWEEFCEYACDDAEKEPIIFYDDDYYLILNKRIDEFEIVDCATKNPDKIWNIIQHLQDLTKEYQIKRFVCETLPNSFQILKKFFCDDKIEIIKLEKAYDQEFQDTVRLVSFEIK